MNQALPKRAQFHHMKDGTQEDWDIIDAEFFKFRNDVCKRIKAHLMLLEGDCGGFAIDRSTDPFLADGNARTPGRQGRGVRGLRVIARYWRHAWPC